MIGADSVNATAGARSDAGGAMAAPGIAGFLCLVASPTFALMAWIAAHDAPPVALCASASTILPVGGMSTMYLLMSLFHLSPWLKLASGNR